MNFHTLNQINDFLWGHLAFILIFVVGIYFSIRSRFFQIRSFGKIFCSFISFFKEKQTGRGVHPITVFFAAIGGCIGIGNVVGIITAVTIGGPGALFWTWIGGLAGMLIQYAEVYLGIKHRVKNDQGGFDGGPMYFLPVAYRGKWIAFVICFLLCIYGVEIFMFNVVTESISRNWGLNEYWVATVLLVLVLVVATGGIKRVGEVCSALIPLFILFYMVMSLWVIFHHAEAIPAVFRSVFEGAFTKQAAQGAFAGSTVMLAISMGLSRGAYSGDIGVGYTSVIYAESGTKKIKSQSSMTVVAVFLDTFIICTLSTLVVLTTDYWHTNTPLSLMVQEALGMHFPYMHIFMPVFLFLLGITTILSYFVAGIKCAKFIAPRWGPILYYAYATVALPLFAFVDPSEAFVIMSLSGALLLILNLSGIFILRKQIAFGLEDH